MIELIENKEHSKFRLKAVAELLDGNHHFFIPSYQRGYRWDKKQVEDLLKDIWDFANNSKKGDFYCLQPVVVKPKVWKEESKETETVGWEIIDGQQRLTTIFLLLKYLQNNSEDAKNSKAIFYDIHYETRPELDFDNPQKEMDIDSFHASTTKEVIEQWFINNTVRKSKIVEVLFDDYSEDHSAKSQSEWEPQVKIIWYATEDQEAVDSIKVFNNLNKGKIRLTNAELIKALFVLKTREEKNGKKVEQLNINEFAYEWNEIENKLQDNRFWYFLANKDYNPATRIDLIFDFLTGKENQNDDDFAYRKFQNLYDKTEDVYWTERKVENFTNAWNKVKEVYQTFLYWFEDGEIYHYIGYLVYNGISLRNIYTESKNKNKSETVASLQKMISTKLLDYGKKDIDSFTHNENRNICMKILLFFNIQTCVIQLQNQNTKINNEERYSYYKFPFDLLKLNDWDVEHVGSQTENPLKDIEDKIIWLSYIPNIITNNIEWVKIREESNILLEELKSKNKDEGNKFQDLYTRIIAVIQKSENDIKDTLENLALLDSGTNRGYGNALFPSKRQIIIQKDMDGVFIPVCTRNLFLKYYSQDENDVSQWKNSWEDSDRETYLKAIHDTIDFILN